MKPHARQTIGLLCRKNYLCKYVVKYTRHSMESHSRESHPPGIRKTVKDSVCMFRFVCHSADFYEEMLALLDMFTTVSVSPQMWQMMSIIFDSFSRDGFDYFTGTTYLLRVQYKNPCMLAMQVWCTCVYVRVYFCCSHSSIET